MRKRFWSARNLWSKVIWLRELRVLAGEPVLDDWVDAQLCMGVVPKVQHGIIAPLFTLCTKDESVDL